MIRIVGVQRSEDLNQEFIVLQNQGNMRVNLRGYALVAEASVDEPSGLQEVYVIRDDVSLPAGHYAVVRSGSGSPRWVHDEGYHYFYTFLARNSSVWNRLSGPIHVLAPQHTFCERSVERIRVGR
ncbi:MAG: lamin tail domain-containing protein [Armatimonadetes bacterium]|nr:lamin tail domain-containing protein [Armatimonadota bacterium]